MLLSADLGSLKFKNPQIFFPKINKGFLDNSLATFFLFDKTYGFCVQVPRKTRVFLWGFLLKFLSSSKYAGRHHMDPINPVK